MINMKSSVVFQYRMKESYIYNNIKQNDDTQNEFIDGATKYVQ